MKKEKKSQYYHYDSHQKHKDNLTLLFTDLRFLKEVTDIRNYLHIPKNGLDKDDLGSYKKWEKELYESSERMMDSQAFQRKLKSLFGAKQKGEMSPMKYKQELQKINGLIPLNYLQNQAKMLTEEFNVPLNYKENIRHFILSNDHWLIPCTPFTIGRGVPENRHERVVTATFHSQVTDEDLKMLKHEINEYFGDVLPKVSPVKDMETKVLIEKYTQDRNVVDEIEMKPYRLSAKEIAKNVQMDTRKKVRVKDIYEAPRELERLRRKRFRKNSEKSLP